MLRKRLGLGLMRQLTKRLSQSKDVIEFTGEFLSLPGGQRKKLQRMTSELGNTSNRLEGNRSSLKLGVRDSRNSLPEAQEEEAVPVKLEDEDVERPHDEGLDK